jgi:hypothetical protein
MKMFSHLWQYLTELFLETEIFQIKAAQKITTYFMFSSLLSENRAVYRLSKQVVVPERPQMTIWRGVSWWIIMATCAQAHSRARVPTPPSTHTHTHTHREICNTYCLSTLKMVSRTHLNITLYVHCLSCFYLCLYLIENCNSYSHYKRTYSSCKASVILIQYVNKTLNISANFTTNPKFEISRKYFRRYSCFSKQAHGRAKTMRLTVAFRKVFANAAKMADQFVRSHVNVEFHENLTKEVLSKYTLNIKLWC